jgi:hypothetical protein
MTARDLAQPLVAETREDSMERSSLDLAHERVAHLFALTVADAKTTADTDRHGEPPSAARGFATHAIVVLSVEASTSTA